LSLLWGIPDILSDITTRGALFLLRHIFNYLLRLITVLYKAFDASAQEIKISLTIIPLDIKNTRPHFIPSR
jgi:hypothetical protein